MTTTTRTPVETFDRELLWHFRARLVKVHDGDTIDVETDLGFRARYQPAIRLLNTYADELWTPTGKDAAKALAAELTDCFGPGWPLRVVTTQLETVVGEDTTFERWVADIYRVNGDGSLQNIGDWMVNSGHASRQPTAKSVREGIAILVPPMKGATHGQ